ncbi:MAG: 2-dehydro-3-deoxygalactonokinase, partial [Rhodomicrobium sp.]|nr:2-dehydro-3-deoxygalactonokinase [Rhodomicrobium sp.]
MTLFTARGARIFIAPGLSCTNPFGMPDVMRGEEVQILGALTQSGTDAGVFCLPGTHAKWVIAEGGAVTNFFTSMQGELYDLLARRSILADSLPPAEGVFGHAFDEAVAVMRDHPALSLSHALFSIRSRRLIGGLAAPDAHAALSGLLIGADVRDAPRVDAQLLAEPAMSDLEAAYGRPALFSVVGGGNTVFALDPGEIGTG